LDSWGQKCNFGESKFVAPKPIAQACTEMLMHFYFFFVEAFSIVRQLKLRRRFREPGLLFIPALDENGN